MPGYQDPGFDTLALHAGAAPDPATGARALPIHLSAGFVFASCEQAAERFHLERGGHVYSRISNPTTAVFEQRIAALEGGVGAVAAASGQAALHLAIATLTGAGGHIVASSALCGAAQHLLAHTLRRFGIASSFVAPGAIDCWRAALRPNTRLFFGQTLSNPGLDVLDIPAVADIAHQAGVPLLVDSTLTTPWLIQPLAHGADLVCHSAGKFLCGHGTVLGGVLVDGGSFDWDGPRSAGRFAELSTPCAALHGMVPSEEASVGAFLLHARHVGLRDFGACLGAHSAWLILQGMETLALRMERHMRNTERVVEFLAAQPLVAQVAHPMLATHPGHALARRLLPRGAGAVLGLELKGARAQCRAFIEALQLFSHLAHVGDCRSLVLHPASTTHAHMDEAALRAAAVTQATIGLSIGLEDADDLLDDLRRALRAAGKVQG